MSCVPRRLPWLLLISALIIFARPPDQDLGRAPHPHGRRHSRHTPRSAHHPLDQRGRSLLALRQLRLAPRGPLGPDRLLISWPRWSSSSSWSAWATASPSLTVALALIFAGALGNVHDRILYGSVVDFIEVHIFTYHWPDFNLADSSIVTGACLLLLDSLLPKKTSAPITLHPPRRLRMKIRCTPPRRFALLLASVGRASAGLLSGRRPARQTPSVCPLRRPPRALRAHPHARPQGRNLRRR